MAKKIVTLLLALNLLISPFGLTAYAEEPPEVQTETMTDGGLTTQLTTTTEVTTDPDGKTVVTVTVNKKTEGTDANGAACTGEETRVDTTVSNQDGTIDSTCFTEQGKEIVDKTDPVTPEDTEVPEAELILRPGETVSDVVEGTVTEVRGDVPSDGADGKYDYTQTTTTVNRTVEAGMSEILTTEQAAGDVTLESVAPEDYDGKSHIKPDHVGPAQNVLKYCDQVTVTNEDGSTSTKWIPRVVRTEEEMPAYLKDYYEYDGERGKWIPKSAAGKYTYEWTWDYVLAENGEYSTAGAAVANGIYQDTSNMVLYDENGERVFAYCIDSKTGTSAGNTYVAENLDDADYFSEESARDHIRAIALHGYWGSKSGTGSFANLKQGLIDALNRGLEVTISFQDGANGPQYDYNSTDPEDLAALLDMANHINEGEALAATQGALWSYGRDSAVFQGFDPYRDNADDATETDGVWQYDHGGPEARMLLICEYLKSLTAEKTESTLIEPDSMLKEDGIRLTVKEQAADCAANSDADKGNDIYNVDLSFALVVEPSTEKGDDMIVKLIDHEGNVIRIARLAGDGSNDVGFDTVTQNGNTFTFENLQLAENSDLKFDLRLEGLQHLEQGVYIYKSTKGYDGAQTLIGVSEGSHEFAVQTSFTVNFNVDEEKTVVAERLWHAEGKTEYAEATPGPDESSKPEPNQPHSGKTEDRSEVPKTGYTGGKWVALFSGSCFGMAVLLLYMIRRTEE